MFAGFIGNVPVILAKPQTLMNISGESVSNLVHNHLPCFSENFFQLEMFGRSYGASFVGCTDCFIQ